MATPLENAATQVRSAIKAATRGLVERRVLVDLVALAAVAREHVLVVGPPGTAKSQAVRNIAGQLEGQYFEYLIGRFTEPTDIFGAIDLAKLRQGQVVVQTAGMLPEAEIAFLDEVFLGSTAILNTLLALLNERTFVRGHTRMKSPLRVCVGASNRLPEEPALEAFADRFLLRAFVEPLPDELLETLLEAGWESPAQGRPHGNMAALDQLANAAMKLDMAPIRPQLAQAVRTLRGAGIHLGDRRIVKTQKLVAAAAALRGAGQASAADLWPLVYCVPTAEQQEIAREVLHDQLAESANHALGGAAEEASASLAARSARLVDEISTLLAEADGSPDQGAAEALLREVSASFSDATLPSALKALSEELARAIEQPPAATPSSSGATTSKAKSAARAPD